MSWLAFECISVLANFLVMDVCLGVVFIHILVLRITELLIIMLVCRNLSSRSHVLSISILVKVEAIHR